MIEHLRLLNHKGLAGCELHDLGKINVVCGKNNSGKSTVLEAILDKDKSIEGKRLIGVQIEALREAVRTATNVTKLSPAQETDVAQMVEAVQSTEGIWYSDQSQTLVQRLGDQRQQRAIGALGWAPQHVLAAYQRFFVSPTERTSVLVSPKRQLQLSVAISTGDTASPSGTGILNDLNYLRNKRGGSAERALFERIREGFRNVSGGYDFEIEPDRSNQLHLSFGFNGGTPIPAQDSGLGLQDLLVLLYFSIHPSARLVLIEEPESHLHPDMQRKLLFFMQEETGPDRQFVLATHSNVFLDNALADRVFFTSYDGRVKVDDATSRASILDDLGYSVTDNLVSDLVILVEGPTDVGFVEEFLKKAALSKSFNIKMWSLGGDIMDKQDLTIFAEHYSIIALLDRDPKSDVVRRRFEKNCDDVNIPVHRLERLAIENYSTVAALRKVFKGQIPAGFEKVDHQVSLAEQLGFEVKRNNRRIAREMELSDIDGTDFRLFLDKVDRLCRERADPKHIPGAE